MIGKEEIIAATKNFKDFIKYIFRYSFNKDQWVEPSHLYRWADIIQDAKRLVILAPRGHLKSTVMYAYIMWRIWRARFHSESWLYISFKDSMAQYHIRNIVSLIKRNPFFINYKFLTDAESKIRITYDGLNVFEVLPSGVLSFKRGWHGDGIILDDVLSDPSDVLNATVLDKIKQLFYEEIQYLPNPDGYIFIVGTPQTSDDLLYSLKDNPDYKWFKFPAIVDEEKKKVLWPERYTYEMLAKERQQNPRAFLKERMCEPVWEANSFFTKEQIEAVINPRLENLYSAPAEWEVFAGFDVGKKQHPSHFVALRYDAEKDKLIQIHSRWFDGVPYTEQVEVVNNLLDALNVDYIYYDATRGELEAFAEQGLLDSRWKPLNLNNKTRTQIAAYLEEMILGKKIELMPDERQVKGLLTVTQDLEPVEARFDGKIVHGDCYDAETEVLTRGGWKKFYELSLNDEIATLNPRTGELEYLRPRRIVCYWYEGLMYRVRNTQVDLLVTPHHKMYVNGTLVKAKEIYGKKVKYKKSARWRGKKIDKVRVCGREFDIRDWLEFLGYYISEGWVTVRKDGRAHIGISQTKPAVARRIHAVLKRMKIKYTYDARRHTFWIYNTALGNYLKETCGGKSIEKRIPREILELDSELLYILYEALMLGDGTYHKTFRHYYTSSKQLVDDFQELLLKIGKSGNIYVRDFRGRKAPRGTTRHKIYVVSIIEQKNNPVVNKHKQQDDWVWYEGAIYCVEVPRNHIIYVRRNGKPVWSGNSFWSIGMAIYGYKQHGGKNFYFTTFTFF